MHPQESLVSSSTGAGYAAIDAYVEEQIRRLHMPGAALAIVEGDRVVHLRGFGRSRPGGEAPTPQTPFFIASLTKSITALAVMQLAEAGRVELDAPVQRYLPWFRVADPQASAQMTVRHLLHQTSGLPTSAGEIPLADCDDSPGATERQARALATLVLTRPPGAAFEYCNMNYNLLGLVVEAASGEAYADYIQNHILTPLAMRHTYTSPAEAQQNGLAVGYRYWFGMPCASPNLPSAPGSLASGQLISTSEDVARFLIAFLNGGRCGDGQILSAAGIDDLLRGVADIHAMGFALGQYAMGWWVDKIGQAKLAWHGGTFPHFGAHMALLPQQKKGVALLFNGGQHWMMPVLAQFGTGVAALLAGGQPAPSTIAFARIFPWAMRSLLLIPLVQIAAVIATLRQWRVERQRGLQFLLPLIANLLIALTFPYAGQTAPLSGVVHARLCLDRQGLRQLCAGVELFVGRAAPRRTGKGHTAPSAGGAVRFPARSPKP
jgi:CubicO group peptidase (beta-lactamase class C family)